MLNGTEINPDFANGEQRTGEVRAWRKGFALPRCCFVSSCIEYTRTLIAQTSVLHSPCNGLCLCCAALWLCCVQRCMPLWRVKAQRKCWCCTAHKGECWSQQNNTNGGGRQGRCLHSLSRAGVAVTPVSLCIIGRVWCRSAAGDKWYELCSFWRAWLAWTPTVDPGPNILYVSVWPAGAAGVGCPAGHL